MLAIFSRTNPKSPIVLVRRHVGDFFAHQSEIANRLAKRLALLGIGDGTLDRNPGASDAHGAEFEASNVQNVEGDDMSLANFAQQILGRHFAVVEDDGASRRSTN